MGIVCYVHRHVDTSKAKQSKTFGKMQPQIDFGELKYFERGMLECMFKLWRDSDSNRFDINRLWMESNRQSLKRRNRSDRHGIYDWDHLLINLTICAVRDICAVFLYRNTCAHNEFLRQYDLMV